MFDLTGHVALVTGGGQNVGAGIAQALAARGATVAVNDFHADRAERIARQIQDAGGLAIATPFDVTDLDAVEAGFDTVSNRVGPVDILVNNAGTGGPTTPLQVAKFADMAPEQWRPVVAVNLFGPMNCAKTAIGSMIDRGWGRVITISSGAGEIGMDLGVSHYGAAKAGAIGFMRHLAIENAGHGITANTISLGLVLDDPGIVEALANTIPVKRMGTPADVGALAVYLASAEASWITGQTIGLNGGSLTS
ncbi:SDR family NAD(P)-dependent oxidoreductase [Mycobacterium sp. 94-17]|uniref:SDR family NAD(P)-dependent oxidoreductase n=1 Tax=Mycobacterium sp. 94-17 TaxID=2986147 RepID=UPI002D1F0452|nr:SDR family NAD(P)-dependent oxidoreductase [Mycobacterium sp. 94-17]MEB4211751.1 SDR family NAD(P)-dependent oxidoreductase [Mycobacterium sp. 94-17]